VLPAPVAAFAVATLLAVPVVLLPIALVVAAIVGGLEGVGIEPDAVAGGSGSFRGGEAIWRTFAWTAAIGTLAMAVGWAPGRRLAEGAAPWRVLAAVLPLLLPGWLLFHGFWQAIGPGTALGDFVARHELVGFARESALAIGLLASCWPLVAWSVAIERGGGDAGATAALEAVDGLPWPGDSRSPFGRTTRPCCAAASPRCSFCGRRRSPSISPVCAPSASSCGPSMRRGRDPGRSCCSAGPDCCRASC
jgi:hypothetical protein